MVTAFAGSFAKDINFNFVYPVPGSELNSRISQIILKSSEDILSSSLNKNSIRVLGGSHEYKGEITIADDKKTIIFSSNEKFKANEIVTVITGSFTTLKTQEGNKINPYSFSFKVTPLEEPIRFTFDNEDRPILNQKDVPVVLADTIPPDFPKLTINVLDNPYPGYTFISNNSQTFGTFIIILDTLGKTYKFKRTSVPAFDFKVQPNGYLSYQEPISRSVAGDGNAPAIARILDTDLNQIDSVQCTSGYRADIHDFIWAPNGHYFLISYDAQPVDMSQIVSGGNPNAIVIGAIVQELDAKKNLVFQWRSWDHIQFEDSYVGLKTAIVDYVHINAVEFDYDGNIMISSRMLCEITKIDRLTGDVIWRMGGKKNEFTFVNEHEENAPLYFSEQHDIRRLQTGNVTLFDNGNQHLPEYSRAVEYQLDEINKTATMVWDSRHTPDITSKNQGNVQRLSNGSTVIGWGGAGFQGLPSVSEVTPDGRTTLELSLPKGVTFGQTSYRAYKFDWLPGQPLATVVKNDISTSDFPNQKSSIGVRFGAISNLTASAGNSLIFTRYEWAARNVDFEIDAPYVPQTRVVISTDKISSINYEVRFDVGSFQWIKFPTKYSIFYRLSEGTGVFKKLSTTFDAANNELVANVDGPGEFIFGLETSVSDLKAPTQIFPADNQKVNKRVPLKLFWITEGFAQKSELIIASDKDFVTTVYSNSDIKSTLSPPVNLTTGSEFFWKVRCANTKGWSPWSEVRSFTLSNPYITVMSPNGGESWVRDSANYIIRWDENTEGNLRIDLLQNDTLFIPIKDSVKVKSGAIFWYIPPVVPVGNNYKILISNMNDESIRAQSSANFSIVAKGNAVEEQIVTGENPVEIFDNYPNPANQRTNFRFKINQAGIYSIKISDNTGSEVDNLPGMYYPEGNYEFPWSCMLLGSGNYNIEIHNGNYAANKLFILVK